MNPFENDTCAMFNSKDVMSSHLTDFKCQNCNFHGSKRTLYLHYALDNFKSKLEEEIKDYFMENNLECNRCFETDIASEKDRLIHVGITHKRIEAILDKL